MKKIMLTIFSIILCSQAASDAYGYVRYEDKNPKRKIELTMAGYTDYPPFGWSEKNESGWDGYKNVFTPLMNIFIEDAKVELNTKLHIKNTDDLVQNVREGSIDFFVGAYHETEIFKGLHLLYPAVIYNPITVFMMPNRISEVSSTEDLKKLKGVRNVNEIFSDFVNQKVAELKPIEVNSAYEAFEKLFNREADYIISSYYGGMAEAIRLGLKKQIAPAKQSLWRIPMFVGVSKTSRNREMISKRISKYLTDKNNIKAVEQNIQTLISEMEKKYEGVVPPSFLKDRTPEEKPAE